MCGLSLTLGSLGLSAGVLERHVPQETPGAIIQDTSRLFSPLAVVEELEFPSASALSRWMNCAPASRRASTVFISKTVGGQEGSSVGGVLAYWKSIKQGVMVYACLKSQHIKGKGRKLTSSSHP